MKDNLRGYTINILFALNVFIVFLLLFENKLIVPQWLQPIGRMHPLILHFPIVLLLLSMVMEFFRFRSVYNTEVFYQNFTSNLLFIGVLSSGITVIMGLFLSQESGYSSPVLVWHKWAGIGVFFIASLIYTYRNSTWYKGTAAKAGAIITTLCLILAGHFGATLTHGTNFIWQSVLTPIHSVVSVEQALVFDHVIKPIFEKKCVSCHNPDKLKGKLILTDSSSILKGGKSGVLFVEGKPEESLLLKRIHLPLDDKKHMPPSGKAQLTHEETELLRHWIAADASFSKKVIAFPLRDSLRLLATEFLGKDEAREIFTFAAADEQTIKELNTNYRVVYPLSNESPAICVNFFNRDAYNHKALADLNEVRNQIISLELNKMPVKNSDLKTISRFKNLRRLNLNFTDITGSGLESITSLKNLKTLTLSGTKMKYTEMLQYLPYFKSLQTLALWDTGLSTSEVQQLQSAFKGIQFFGGSKVDASYMIKLNPPRLRNKPVVFEDSVPLQLFHPVKDVEIRFTTDGTEPDSLKALLFRGETILKASTVIKARAYKPGWRSSDAVSLNLYRSTHKPDSVILLSRLNRVHPANGAQTFFDQELGSFNANSPAWANNWAGVINNDLSLLLHYKTPRLITSIGLNMLIETETYIFPPSSIEIWAGPEQDNLKLITKIKPDQPTNYSKPFIKFIDCKFKPLTLSYLKIVVHPVMKLPGWHKRKDKPALLLVDEMFIN